ncbi:unnamed protein product, partial [Bubo scandiacus]
QVHLKASVAMVMPVLQQVALKGLWPKDKSMLEKVHLKAQRYTKHQYISEGILIHG